MSDASPKGSYPSRYEHSALDADYLDRLERGVQPDGDMVTNKWHFESGDLAIWQVQLRGDDVLELIRLARLAMQKRTSSRGEGSS